MTDLDRAEQLAAAATPGPWNAYFTSHGDPYVLGRPRDRHGRDPLFPQDIVATVATGPADYGRSDAEFIAAARELVPALVARVRELERHVEELQDKEALICACACSYDKPGDVCMFHTPRVRALSDAGNRMADAIKAQVQHGHPVSIIVTAARADWRALVDTDDSTP